jgi:outer membrane lipoprotein-sorting protein
MRTLSLLAALTTTLPVAGQADDAAKLFQGMERALTRAKTLRASAGVVMQTPEGDIKLVGAVHLAEGDRANLSFDSTVDGKHRKGTLVSDGKRMRWAVGGSPGPERPTPVGLGRLLAGKFARAGVGFSFFLATGDEAEEPKKGIDALYPASGFRLGAKERVGGRDAQVVEYRLTWAGKEPVFRASVWVDVKTSLPLKRVLTASKGGNTIRITEVYADVTRDAKLDDKLFDLPK